MPERAPMQPIRDNVLIKPDEAKTVSESGFHLPTAQTDKGLRRGTVIATGDGVEVDGEKVPMKIKVGDSVMYTKYGPMEFEFEKVKYVLCPQYDIVGIFNG